MDKLENKQNEGLIDEYINNGLDDGSKYFLVSYSHNDREVISSILEKLIKANANFWIDKGMVGGDIWTKEFCDKMQDKNCIGVMFFLSESSIISDAVFKEMKMMQEKLGNNNNFKISPIFIKYKDEKEKKKSAYDILADDIFVKNSSDIRLEKSSVFADIMAKGERKYIIAQEDNIDFTVQEILDGMKKEGAVSYNVEDIKKTKMNRFTDKDMSVVQFGKYSGDKIHWRLFKREGNILKFISKYCVDFIAKSEIKSLIDEIINYSFDEREKNILRDVEGKKQPVYLIDDELILNESKNIGDTQLTDELDEKRMQALKVFWGKKKSDDAIFIFNSKNKIVDKPIDFSTINAGVRLVMEIDENKIGD